MISWKVGEKGVWPGEAKLGPAQWGLCPGSLDLPANQPILLFLSIRNSKLSILSTLKGHLTAQKRSSLGMGTCMNSDADKGIAQGHELALSDKKHTAFRNSGPPRSPLCQPAPRKEFAPAECDAQAENGETTDPTSLTEGQRYSDKPRNGRFASRGAETRTPAQTP